MPELSKIVKQRLQAMPRPPVHPTQDLLGAFAENSLQPADRTQVLEHLAACAECREVVSLSSSVPESDLEHLVAAAAASDRAPLRDGALFSPAPMAFKSARPRWPMLRWGGMAAAVAVVMVGATMLMRQDHFAKPATMVAQREKAEVPSAPAPQYNADSGVSSKPPATSHPGLVMKPQAMPARRGEAEAARHDEDLYLDKKAAVTRDQAKRELALTQPPASGGTAGATASGSLADNTSRDEIFTGKPSEATAAKVTSAPAAPASQNANAVSEVAKQEGANSKDAPAAQASVALSLARAQTEQNFKSTDQLEADAELRQVMQQIASEKKGLAMKSSPGNLRKKKEDLSGQGKFRALASLGNEVWIGGLAGLLYHSTDAGQHWAQVKPVAEGKPLVADIVDIKFADANSGKLTAADGEIWSTADAGITWSCNK